MRGHREHYLGSVSRLEVLAGPTGQRRGSDAMKGRIVAESLVRRHSQVCCGAVWAEARSFVVVARAGKLAVPDFAGASFATVVVVDVLPPSPVTLDRIELVVGSVTLRLDAATPPVRIIELATALRASA